MAAATAPTIGPNDWAPNPGGQTEFLTCPAWECLYEGERGGGKTDGLVMDFGQHVGHGFGSAWRGVLFRRTYVQLADVIVRSRRWFTHIFPGARYNESSHTWRFADGEELLFRYFQRDADYWNYHGHEYPWIGFEELTNWPTEYAYEQMKSCSRSSRAGMPRKIRATCNPWGVGHQWVKRYFIDPGPAKTLIADDVGLLRTRIRGGVEENKPLVEADPEYIRRLDAIKNPELRKAWRYGDWDVVVGGALGDHWDRSKHVLEPFAIPASWRVDRSFDWGSSAPFSVLWWAESDGTEAILPDGTARSYPRGALFLVAELYGGNPTKPAQGVGWGPTKIATEILRVEKRLATAGLLRMGARKIRPGPADTQIWDKRDAETETIASKMEAAGVRWERATKGPGSRVIGLQMIHDRLDASAEWPPEAPGLYVFSTCSGWLSRVPTLILDERNPEDIADGQEDHDYDGTRYRLIAKGRGGGVVGQGSLR